MTGRQIKKLVIQMLTDARNIVKTSCTQKAFARDKNGFQCYYYEPQAVLFCASGAIKLSAKNNKAQWFEEEMTFYLFKAANNITDLIGNWNDKPDRTQAEVLEAFNKAIAYTKRTKL